MRIEPELNDVSIVLLGSFNPRIFRPDWFARNDLVSADEAEASEIKIVHPEITIFQMEWLQVRVEQQRFIAETTEAPFIRLSDLVVRTFKEFLSHTPVTVMGINRRVHFRVGDDATIEHIGDILAPKKPWGEWGPLIKAGEGKRHGGMRSLVMEQRALDDRYSGHIQARVQPSIKVKSGIFMQVNDQYEVENPENVVGCDEIITILQNNFETSIKRAEWIIDQIMALK